MWWCWWWWWWWYGIGIGKGKGRERSGLGPGGSPTACLRIPGGPRCAIPVSASAGFLARSRALRLGSSGLGRLGRMGWRTCRRTWFRVSKRGREKGLVEVVGRINEEMKKSDIGNSRGSASRLHIPPARFFAFGNNSVFGALRGLQERAVHPKGV